MTQLIIALLFSTLGNIIAWFQMNGQFKYEWMRQWWVIGLTGIPVSYMFFYSTRWYYEYFNNYWFAKLGCSHFLAFSFVIPFLLAKSVT